MFGSWFWIFNALWIASMFGFGWLFGRHEPVSYEVTELLLSAVIGSTIMSRLDSLRARSGRSDLIPD